MTCDLSIVVAVYNEDPRNLWLLLDRLQQIIAPMAMSYEVVFVNDGSNSNTSQALHALVDQFEHVKLISLSRNFGQQAAISAGLNYAEGQAVINMDSDLQDPPELIPEMVKRWQQGYDVVYAQRSARRDHIWKRFSAFLFYRMLGCVASVQIPWDTGDFRLVDRRVVNALAALPEKTRFLRGMIPWLGFKQIGIPLDRDARTVGESSYTLRKLFALAADGILSFSVAPLYVILLAGTSILAISAIGFIAWAICLQGELISIPHHYLIPSAIVLAMMFLTGIQMVGSGLIAVYLSKVLDETRARPTYIVAERLGARYNEEEEELYTQPLSTTRDKLQRERIKGR